MITERLSAAQQLQGPGQWRWNLTEDGDVEPNPGPSQHKKIDVVSILKTL